MTTRRQFLVWAAVAVAGTSALGWTVAAWRSFEARLERARPLALAWFAAHDRAAVLTVGSAWLAVVAPERDDAALGLALRDVLADLDGIDEAHAVESIGARIAADFAELRTVDVSGWTLSATEVVLAAILDLSDDAPPDDGSRRRRRRARRRPR